MGIRYLNSYLRSNCKNGIQEIDINEMSGKSIVIDVSIYIYQFDVDDKLIENMTRFIDILKANTIEPIFVFDGKPPAEKFDVINKRKEVRKKAIEDCATISKQLEVIDESNEEYCYLLTEYNKLKRSSVQITREKIKQVKSLIISKELVYIDSPSEADQVCAALVVWGNCWGCMSDDMDMFIYGCKYIIREINIESQKAVLYNLDTILHELNINYENFKCVCVLSGTDYQNQTVKKLESSEHVNSSSSNMNLNTAFKLFKRYNKTVKYNMKFYDWLRYYIKYKVDYPGLEKVYDMFNLPNKNVVYSSIVSK